MKKISILISSNGNNDKLGQAILKAAKDKGFDATAIKLVDLNLPLYSTEQESNGIPDKAIELADQLIASDSLVVVAPEYNGSIPPVLNNAVAWVSRSSESWREAFNGKPTLIATHSGGGGAHALMSMRQQFSYIGANVLGRQILTTYSKELSLESLDECLGML